jgi:hypothetical protein
VIVLIYNIGSAPLVSVTITSVTDQAAGGAAVQWGGGTWGIAPQGQAITQASVTSTQAKLNAGTAVTLVATVTAAGLTAVTSSPVTIAAEQDPGMRLMLSTGAGGGINYYEGERCLHHT